MNKIKLSFGVSAMPMYAVFIKNGRKTLEVQAFDGYITVSVQYDYARRPLSLNSEFSAGDSCATRTGLTANGCFLYRTTLFPIPRSESMNTVRSLWQVQAL